MQTTVFLFALLTLDFLSLGGFHGEARADVCDNTRSEVENRCLSTEIRKPDKKDADFTYRNRCSAEAASAYRQCLAATSGPDGCVQSKNFIEKVAADGGNLYHIFDDHRRTGLKTYSALVKLAGAGGAVQKDLVKCKRWAENFLERVAPSASCEALQKQITSVLNHDLAARESFERARKKGQTAWIAMRAQISRLPKGTENLKSCGAWAPVYLIGQIAPLMGIVLPKSMQSKTKSTK